MVFEPNSMWPLSLIRNKSHTLLSGPAYFFGSLNQKGSYKVSSIQYKLILRWVQLDIEDRSRVGIVGFA